MIETLLFVILVLIGGFFGAAILIQVMYFAAMMVDKDLAEKLEGKFPQLMIPCGIIVVIVFIIHLWPHYNP